MLKKTFQLLLIGLITIAGASCGNGENAKVIDFEKIELPVKKTQSVEKPLRIAIGGMITPREGFAYYKKLLDYLEEELELKVDLVDREDYSEINSMLRREEIDLAFVCGGPYVDGHSEFGMELLVAPKAYGGTVYYSYIIVHKDSKINDLSELRGKSFAFTDPLSNTGKLVPTYMLAQMKETPETFFKKYEYTSAHALSIKAVATKIIDGAAVDSLIWEYANRTNPEFSSQTKIIKKSPPYGIPPLVVRPDLPIQLKKKIQRLLLNIHKEERGQTILKGMMIEKFVEIDDSAYDSIREMKSWIKKSRQE